MVYYLVIETCFETILKVNMFINILLLSLSVQGSTVDVRIH